MEVAGIALGTVSVSALFSSFFDCIERIEQLKGVRGDLESCVTALEFERLRLQYINDRYGTHQLDQTTEPLLKFLLNETTKEAISITEIILKYCPKLQRTAHSSLVTPGCQPTHSNQPGPISLIRRITWAADDNKEVSKRLSTLQRYTASLWDFAMTEAEKTGGNYSVRTRIIATDDEDALGRVNAVNMGAYRDISGAARVKQLLLIGLKPNDSADRQAQYYVPLRSIRRSGDNDTGVAADELWTVGKRRSADEKQTETSVLIEWRGSFMGNPERSTAERRLNEICHLLTAMYDAEEENANLTSPEDFDRHVEFGLLKCLGWTQASQAFNKIGVVFEFPSGNTCRPQTLRGRISETRRDGKTPPPALGYRFDIAFKMCNAIANILAVGWRHRAVRSENILIFGQRSLKVFLTGFTYSRPEDPLQEFSELPQGKDWDYYRLPESAMSPTGSFYGSDSDQNDEQDDKLGKGPFSANPGTESLAQDLYGLGMVLLEIGLWQTAHAMAKGKGLEEFQNHTIRKRVAELPYRCGTLYHDVVEKCLDYQSWNQQGLAEDLARLLTDLKQCRA